MPNKILFISYLYPPTGGAGVQRVAKLSKYFSKFGWEVHVLTASNPSVPVEDEKLLNDIPIAVKIHKAFSFEIPYQIKSKIWKKINGQKDIQIKQEVESQKDFSLTSLIKRFINAIFIPDYQIGWIPLARIKAKKIIRDNEIPYVFISAPPFSPFLLGQFLKKNNVKLILDFRDEWTEFYLKSYTFHKKDSKLFSKIEKMERDAIEMADMITMATGSFVNNYEKKYPKFAYKFKTLTNGYDSEDFPKDKKYNSIKDKFTIVYTGTIFSVTTVRYFLKALGEMINEFPEFYSKIQFIIAGRITPDEEVFFEQFKYKRIIVKLGYIEHSDSINLLYKANLLLVTVDELEGSERIIAAKVFEYIKIGVPILALVPENGEIAKILYETNTGIIISNRKVREIKKIVKDFIDNKVTIIPQRDKIERYSRENLTLELISYLLEI